MLRLQEGVRGDRGSGWALGGCLAFFMRVGSLFWKGSDGSRGRRERGWEGGRLGSLNVGGLRMFGGGGWG